MIEDPPLLTIRSNFARPAAEAVAALAATPSGHLVVDDGAAHALREQGSSLLPAGITAVEGTFGRGDTVSIVGPARKN